MAILYELKTNDGDYEDYREYTLYRNTSKEAVEEVKKELEKRFSEMLTKKLRGVTDKDIEVYDSPEYNNLPDAKWDKIYKQRCKEIKIRGLGELRIEEVEYDTVPGIEEMLKQLDLVEGSK
jgi:hypothetical protein